MDRPISHNCVVAGVSASQKGMGIVINDGPVFPIGEFGVRHNALLPRPGGDPGENQPGYRSFPAG